MEFFYTRRDPLIITVICLSFILLGILLKEVVLYLRRITPKKLQCWFCHEESKIPYESANGWMCKRCDQYNGFSKDGGYNKDMPNHHDVKLNSKTYTYTTSGSSWHSRNKLCDKCNLKQQFKVQQLASFVPMNERSYDKEVEHFQKQIEKGFEICQDCEVLVSKVLNNIREELSLPKKLSTAISKINIRGERAIYINILLSLLLSLSSFKFSPSFKKEIEYILFDNSTIRDYMDSISAHPLAQLCVMNAAQVLIGTGILTNSIGFYQTSSTPVFLNVLSWTLIFFLTLYPSGLNNIVNILKFVSSFISMTISVLILLKNHSKRSKRKGSILTRKNVQKLPSTPGSHLSRSPSCSNVSVPVSYADGKQSSVHGTPNNINSGMSSLSIGVRQRKELPRASSGLINPAKFNPFSKVSPTNKIQNLSASYATRAGGSERNYQMPNKSGSYYEPSVFPAKWSSSDKLTSFNCKGSLYEQAVGKSGVYYDTSPTPPSVYEGYDSPDPVATIPSYSCSPQPYCPCTPTLAYYFSTQHFPKLFSSPSQSYPVSSTPNSLHQKETVPIWTFLYSLPTVFLVFCNLILLYTLYSRGDLFPSLK